MSSLALDRRAVEDLDRLSDFLIAYDPDAAEATLMLIRGALATLESHPLIGRPVEGDLRELVISQGKTGYIALYHHRQAADHVQVRAIRHQREAGFDEEG
jgi:plasmid stabilization system protein ParE